MELDLYTVLTLFGHPNIQAFLQSTGLTPVPRHLVYDTDFVSVACVHHVLLDAPPKEALTQEMGAMKDRIQSSTVHMGRWCTRTKPGLYLKWFMYCPLFEQTTFDYVDTIYWIWWMDGSDHKHTKTQKKCKRIYLMYGQMCSFFVFFSCGGLKEAKRLKNHRGDVKVATFSLPHYANTWQSHTLCSSFSFIFFCRCLHHVVFN